MVEKFLRVGNHDRKSQLFRQVLSTKKGMKLRRDPMSYSQAAELIKAKLRKEGLDRALYVICSLRAGGTTTAADCWGLEMGLGLVMCKGRQFFFVDFHCLTFPPTHPRVFSDVHYVSKHF